jgi:hypothetical protein
LLPGLLPTTSPDQRYLLIFDGVGHGGGGQMLVSELASFVAAKLEP